MAAFIPSPGSSHGKLSVGVIGCGYWGPNLLRNFAACPLTTCTVVCDTNPARLEEIGRQYREIQLVGSVDQLLARRVQAVAIATPVLTHFALAQRCLEAGVHVLLEKPMTASAAEASALIELAARRRCVLMVDHTCLFSGAIRRIREIFDQGCLGKLHYLDGIRINRGPFQCDVNVVWDLAAHDLSIADYLLGARARSISACGRISVTKDVEDIAFVNVEYDGGMLAHFHVNRVSPVKVRQWTIGGSRRTLIHDDLDSAAPLKVYDLAEGPSPPAPSPPTPLQVQGRGELIGQEIWSPSVDNGEPLQAVVRHFAECIQQRRAPLSDGRQGLRVVRLLEAASRSIRDHGRWVSLSSEDDY